MRLKNKDKLPAVFSIIAIVCLCLVLAVPFLILAQEQLTITTYYPSPYGVYNVLRLFPSSQPATCQQGELSYHDGSGGITAGLYYCDGTNWNLISSAGSTAYWTQSGTDLYPNQANWRVGIGTTSPQGALHVNPSVAAGDDFVVSTGGSVGIGITGPGARLDVNSASGALARMGTAINIGTSETNALAIGGRNHDISASAAGTASIYSGVFAGDNNDITGSPRSVIVGGIGNRISAPALGAANAAIVGGESNFVNSNYAGTLAGRSNAASGNYSSVVGGMSNTASGNYTIVAGGLSNTASQDRASVVGGWRNTASGFFSGVLGGQSNSATNRGAFVVAAGSSNAGGQYGGVFGGTGNTVPGNYSVVIGAGGSTASGGSSGVFASGSSTASGSASVVLGGRGNFASGRNSAAMGLGALATHDNSFVWSSSNPPNNMQNMNSTGAGTFTIRADGGVYVRGNAGQAQPYLRISYGADPSARLQLTHNGNNGYINSYGPGGAVSVLYLNNMAWLSSRRWKKDIKSIDDALSRVQKARGVSFTWDKEHGSQKDLGVIAEELVDLFPEVVTYDLNGDIAGVKYERLTAVLIEAVKEQQEQIDMLRERISKLEK